MNSKPRLQVFLQNLSDEKAAEMARRMPFFKKDFRVGVTYIESGARRLGAAQREEGFFRDSGIPLTGVDVVPLPPDEPLNYLQPFQDSFEDEVPQAALAILPGCEAAAFLIAARAAGVPLVMAEFDDQPCLLSHFEELSALHFCDLILPATHVLQRALIQTVPHLALRSKHLLPHSADTTYIQQCREDRRRLRASLNVDAELKMITMIAPFDQRRDHDTLLEACALLKQRGHEFILLLVGDGSQRQRIAERVFALRLEDQVSIMDDPGDHLDILCATDIFALSTHFEGNFTPLLEAMGQGLAIAATDVPGVNDLIRDGRSGRLAEPKNPESFARALIDLLAQEKIRKKIGSVARKCIENRGNLNQFMPPLISLIKSKIKEFSMADSRKKSRDGSDNLELYYVGLQKKIRDLWSCPDPEFDFLKIADLLDRFPIHMQMDLLEKLCSTQLNPGPLTLFIRPLEKVLAEHFCEHTPLLEMRFLEKLSDFYIELGYTEGAQKLIERMENNVRRELFRFHFSCNRFSGLRAYVKLAKLYEFVGSADRRDFFRLEMREFLKEKLSRGDDYFHLQNAALLELLGESKLATRELQKETEKTIKIVAEVPVARLAPEEEMLAKKSGTKGRHKAVLLKAGAQKTAATRGVGDTFSET